MNFPNPTNPYARNPRQLSNAKATTTLCELIIPLPVLPNLLVSHSAPVVALERLSHFDKNIIRNTWLNTGHSQGIQILFIPYTKHNATIHIVPLISNISDASLIPSIYHGSFLPPIR